jgi:transcriptional regulator with XRE-family HTH domain
MEAMADAVGERIAAYRRRRGLSQTVLAGLVGRSESWLSQVERGVRSVDRLSVLLDLARVLRVDVETLTGRPWQYAPNGGSVREDLEEVARVFSGYSHLLSAPPAAAPARPQEVHAMVVRAHRDYQAARYSDVIRELPRLLTAVDSLRKSGCDGPEDELPPYLSAYVVTAKLLTKLGAGDLASLAADRGATAAAGMCSPSARGTACYQVVCALLRAGRVEDAEQLAVSMAEELQPHTSVDSPTLVSVTGSLWLIAAVSAARRTDREEAWQRLDQAAMLAHRLGEDANYAWTAFGPTNVAIHRVSVAAELGDASGALRAAGCVQPDRLPAGLLSRRTQVHLDLAWAHTQWKRDADAILHLLEAERMTPQAVRFNVRARELVRELLARGRRSQTGVIQALAVRAGVLD